MSLKRKIAKQLIQGKIKENKLGGKRPITEIEFKKMINSFTNGILVKESKKKLNKNLRMVVAMELQLSTGFRVSDILSIDETCIDWDKGEITVVEQKSIRLNKDGSVKKYKTNSRRLNPKTMALLWDFFKSTDGKFFDGYSYKSYWSQFIKAMAMLGIEKGEICSHSIRKAFATFVYKATKDILAVTRLLNHSSTQITMRYIGVEEQDYTGAYTKLDW